MSEQYESYEDLGNRGWDELPTDKVLPIGTYRLVSRTISFKPGDRDRNLSDCMIFSYGVKEATDDVDPEELEALGADYDISSKTVFYRVWLKTGRDYDNLRRHVEKHGVNIDGKTIDESKKELPGTEIYAMLEHRTYDDRDGKPVTDNDPKNFVPTDD